MTDQETTKMVEHKLILFATVRTLWTRPCNFINKAILLWSGNTYKSKFIPFWPLSGESEGIFSKMFRPGHRAGVFIWENFHPGRKNRDLGKRASPASHMNTSIFLERKEWRGEISETEPARLTGLIWRGPKSFSDYNSKYITISKLAFFCLKKIVFLMSHFATRSYLNFDDSSVT